MELEEASMVGLSRRPSVLIVEDDMLIALSMASFLEDECDAETQVAGSVMLAESAALDLVDFAFLDVNVVGDDTFHFARRLSDAHVPFAFVSASNPASIPGDLRDAPFLAKPCPADVIANLLKSSLVRGRQNQFA